MIREKLAKIKILRKIYKKVVGDKKVKGKYKFINRSKDRENLCIILAGYKEFLWDEVFKRIKTFSNENIDICIVSSGIHSEDLNQIAEKNDWSYLSTKDKRVRNMRTLYFCFPKQ